MRVLNKYFSFNKNLLKIISFKSHYFSAIEKVDVKCKRAFCEIILANWSANNRLPHFSTFFPPFFIQERIFYTQKISTLIIVLYSLVIVFRA